MNYQRHYDLLMAKAKPRGLDKSQLTGYYEKHHVQPRSLGGNDEAANLVLLTAREHFVAHWLLTKFTTGSDRHKMLCALASFQTGALKLTSRQVGIARQANAVAASARLSEQNVRLAAEGKHPAQTERSRALATANIAAFNRSELGRAAKRAHGIELASKGKLWSQQDNNKPAMSSCMANTQSRLLAEGKHTSQNAEHNKRLGEVTAKRNAEQATCPHCKTTGGRGGMQVHHFRNCLLNKANAGLSKRQIWASHD